MTGNSCLSFRWAGPVSFSDNLDSLLISKILVFLGFIDNVRIIAYAFKQKFLVYPNRTTADPGILIPIHFVVEFGLFGGVDVKLLPIWDLSQPIRYKESEYTLDFSIISLLSGNIHCPKANFPFSLSYENRLPKSQNSFEYGVF